jgi:hypothetical protein
MELVYSVLEAGFLASIIRVDTSANMLVCGITYRKTLILIFIALRTSAVMQYALTGVGSGMVTDVAITLEEIRDH